MAINEGDGYPEGGFTLPEVGGVDDTLLQRLLEADQGFQAKFDGVKNNIIASFESYTNTVKEYEKATQKKISATGGNSAGGASGGQSKVQTQMRDSLKRLVTIAEFKSDKKVWDQRGNEKLGMIVKVLEKSNKMFEDDTKTNKLQNNNDTETHRILALINGQIRGFLENSEVVPDGTGEGVFEEELPSVILASFSDEALKQLGAVSGKGGGGVGIGDMKKEDADEGLMSGFMGDVVQGLVSKLPIPTAITGMLGSASGIMLPVLAILGGVLWMAFDGIKGFFKAETWGVGKGNAILSSVLGGTDGGIKGMFKGMGKWALLGAGIGAIAGAGVLSIPGAIMGGLLGAAIGGLLGFIGGENISKAIQGLSVWFQARLESLFGGFKNGFWAGIEQLGISLTAWIFDWYGAIWEGIKIVGTFWGTKLKEGYEWLLGKLGVDVDLFYSQVSDAFGEVVDYWKEKIQAVKDFLKNMMNRALDKIGIGADKREKIAEGAGVVKDFWKDKLSFFGDQVDDQRDMNKRRSQEIMAEKKAKLQTIEPKKEEKEVISNTQGLEDLAKMNMEIQKENKASNERLAEVLENNKQQVEVVQLPPQIDLDMGEIRESAHDAVFDSRMRTQRRWGI